MKAWVLVTRGEDELNGLPEALAARDIDVLPYPVLTEVAWTDSSAWRAVESALPTLSWVVFTSGRAPAALLPAAGALAPALRALPVAAVGEATAEAAAGAGFDVHLIGHEGGRALAASLAAASPDGTVLHACGREHRAELRDALGAAGVSLIAVPVYAMDESAATSLPALPAAPPLAVVLTSPRAAGAYLSATGRRFASVRHLALGRTTAEAARRLGIDAAPLRRPRLDTVVEELCPTC